MNKNSFWAKISQSSEELISMFLGLVIVIVVVGLIYNYFQKKRGSVDLEGVTSQSQNIPISPNATGGILLTTPAASPTAVPNTGKAGDYVVKANDSLWKIALANYGSGYNWVDIARENELENPGILKTGQKLQLPSVPKREVVVNQTVGGVQRIEGDTYMVEKGDSLWKIAVRKYADGYKWTEIWNANKASIINPNIIEIGMQLNLPSPK